MADKEHGPNCTARCKCDFGKAAHAKRMRKWRADRRKEKEKESGAVRAPVLRIVPEPEIVSRLVDDAPSRPARPVSVESDRPLGRVGRAIMVQISHIPNAESEHEALIALAVALSETVDNPNAEAKDRTAAAREIKSLLAQMKPAAPAAPQQSAQDMFLARIAAPL